MENPARIDLGADRFVEFNRTLTIVGYDFTAGDFAMQVRDRKNGGALRADLGLVGVTPAAEGVALLYGDTSLTSSHVTAGRLTQAQADQLGLAPTDLVMLSQLKLIIDKATMIAMPLSPADPADDVVLQWDLHVTPAGGVEDKYAGGDFTVRAGVVE